jgi:tight adherence protein C
MSIQVLLFAVMVVAAVPVLVWALHGTVPSRGQRQVRHNLGMADGAHKGESLARRLEVQMVRPTTDSLANLGRRFTPSGMLQRLDRRRYLAGVASEWSLDRLLATKFVCGVLGLGLALLLVVQDPDPITFVGGALIALFGFFGTDAWLDNRARQRQDDIARAFPDVLDQITICVEAGLGIDAAIAHAARNGTGPLADEMGRVLQDLQVGVPRATALENMLTRTNVADIRHFVVAIGQANRYGAPIADVLRVLGTEARDRRRSTAEERAQKMAVKLLFPLIFCILPALFVVLLGPAAIRIQDLGLN